MAIKLSASTVAETDSWMESELRAEIGDAAGTMQAEHSSSRTTVNMLTNFGIQFTDVIFIQVTKNPYRFRCLSVVAWHPAG